MCGGDEQDLLKAFFISYENLSLALFPLFCSACRAKNTTSRRNQTHEAIKANDVTHRVGPRHGLSFMPFCHDNSGFGAEPTATTTSLCFPAFMLHVRMNQLPKIMKHSFRLPGTLAISMARTKAEKSKQGEVEFALSSDVRLPAGNFAFPLFPLSLPVPPSPAARIYQ